MRLLLVFQAEVKDAEKIQTKQEEEEEQVCTEKDYTDQEEQEEEAWKNKRFFSEGR